MTALLYIYLGFILASMIAGIIFYDAVKKKGMHLLVFYVGYVFVQEAVNTIISLVWPELSTAIVYNLYRPLNTIFFAYVFLREDLMSESRRPMIILLAVYLVLVIVTYGFIQSVFVYNSYLYLAGGLVITVLGMLFLYHYFKLDNNAAEQQWLPLLWIAIGIVIFYPVVNISFALYKHLQAYKRPVFGIKLYQLIPRIMSLFLYSVFIYAFYLCHKKKSTLYSPS